MLSVRGARVRRKSRAVQPPGMLKLDLDRPAHAACLDRAIERGAVARRCLGRGGARGLARRRIREDASHVERRSWRIEGVCTERRELRHVRVSDGRGCRLHRGFADVLSERVREHAVLNDAQTHDRERADPDQDRGDHERLTAFVVHGVHSMRRDALALTTKRGSPTKPRGTGSV